MKDFYSISLSVGGVTYLEDDVIAAGVAKLQPVAPNMQYQFVLRVPMNVFDHIPPTCFSHNLGFSLFFFNPPMF